MRGMYTAGVLDSFLDHGISFDGIVGVSAGAAFGVNFLSGQKGRVIRYNKRFNGDKHYLGLLPLLKEGNIVNTQYAYHDVPHKYDIFDDDEYMRSEVPFYAVVTDMQTGRAEYMQIKSVFRQMDILRASGSMPFLSRPVKINGRYYLDGAIADSIPYRFMSGQGYDKLVIILTRDETYKKKPMPPALVKTYYRKYPLFSERLMKRHEMYNQAREEIQKLERSGEVFVIRPSEPITIGRIEKDPDKLQAVHDLGVSDAEKLMTKLEAYLGGSDGTEQKQERH